MRQKLESQLVDLAREGNESAFIELINRHQHKVINFLRRISCMSPLAEDMAQDTFVKAWQSIKRSQIGEFKPWIFKIALNTFHDYCRSQNRAKIRDRLWFDYNNILASQECDGGNDTDIEHLIEQLSPKQRMVIELHYGAGIEYSQISKILEIPIDTVKSHAKRAREKMSELVKQRRSK